MHENYRYLDLIDKKKKQLHNENSRPFNRVIITNKDCFFTHIIYLLNMFVQKTGRKKSDCSNWMRCAYCIDGVLCGNKKKCAIQTMQSFQTLSFQYILSPFDSDVAHAMLNTVIASQRNNEKKNYNISTTGHDINPIRCRCFRTSTSPIV